MRERLHDRARDRSVRGRTRSGLASRGSGDAGRGDSMTLAARTQATLDDRELRLRDDIARRGAALYEDLEKTVSIPTGGRFRAGLDELRGVLCERLKALGATIEMKAGDPRPEWVRLPDDPVEADA